MIMLFFEFKININLFYREKKQKIEDIKKNIRDAILVSCSYSLIVLLLLNILSLFFFIDNYRCHEHTHPTSTIRTPRKSV